ncbi:hypothetical protein B0H16DRAFT_1734867 [Mycena metata]|uniref:Uncharacterized protein n=1 Tax=Mycena metata TaxID=1033252 RepID=A0AAD7HTN2_9AGAR|nr:hypothetical protein B0H16DRAFT_1734867 [Mycena metata]
MLDQIARSSVVHLQAATLETQCYRDPSDPIAAAFFFLILATLRCTIGHVVATLAMIESPSTPDVTYTVEESLVHTSKEKNLNIAVTVPNRQSITSNLSATRRHLCRVGGPFAPWRGLAIRVIYSITHTILARFLLKTVGGLIFGHTLFGATMISILTSLFLPLCERIVPRDQCKPLVPAALVFTVAKHVTVLVPLGLAHLLRLQDITSAQFLRPDGHTLVLVALRILTPTTTALFLALFVLLPPPEHAPSTALARPRILLQRGAPLTAPLAFAYSKSTSRWSKRWVSLCFGLVVVAAEVYVIGGERFIIFLAAARAQLERITIGGW